MRLASPRCTAPRYRSSPMMCDATPAVILAEIAKQNGAIDMPQRTPAQLDTATLRETLAATKQRYHPDHVPRHIQALIAAMEAELSTRTNLGRIQCTMT